MANSVEINTESKNNFRTLLVKFNSYTKYKQPDLFNSENFYSIYSPKKFKLGPREDIMLDLKFNISTSKELDPWISLLTTLKCHGLTLISKHTNTEGTIEVHLQNHSFYYTIEVQKEQCLAFIFLLGQYPTDVIKTEYTLIN